MDWTGVPVALLGCSSIIDSALLESWQESQPHSQVEATVFWPYSCHPSPSEDSAEDPCLQCPVPCP